MPWKEKEIQKLYWNINEVAAMFNIKESAIRYWQRHFGFDIKRSSGSYRIFNRKDILLITEIHRLVKVKRFTVEGATIELKHNPSFSHRVNEKKEPA